MISTNHQTAQNSEYADIDEIEALETELAEVEAREPAPADRPVMKDAAARRVAQSRPQQGRSVDRAQQAPQTLIARSIKITGDIEAAGAIQIDGVVEGRIRAQHLILTENAVVRGEIRAEMVSIRGAVAGPIRANRVHLAKTARVFGDILHSEFGVEPGAQFEGSVKFAEAPLDDADAPRA